MAVEEAEKERWGGGVVDAVGGGGLEGHLNQCQGLRFGWRLVLVRSASANVDNIRSMGGVPLR